MQDAAEQLRIGGDEIAIHVTSEATGGSLLAAQVRIPAGGGPPALHRHEAEEIYRLERGELTVYLADADGEVRRIPSGAGTVVHIPGGRSHTVRNESGDEAVAFVVFSPGAQMERFVRAAGELAAGGPPRGEDVASLAERHGIEFTGALPAQR